MKFKEFYYKEAVYGEPNKYYIPKGIKPDEYIISAAIKDPKTGDIILGVCHGVAFYNAHGLSKTKYKDFERGFYTNKNHFLSRDEAMELVKRNKQLKFITTPKGYSKSNELDSWDFTKDKHIKDIDMKESVTEKHVYHVSNVYVRGNRKSGETTASSPKEAIINIIIRNLTPEMKNSVALHIKKAFELRGFKVEDLGILQPNNVSDFWYNKV